MTIYCLMHHHDNGSDAYLFKSDHANLDMPNMVAAQLEIQVDPGEQVDIAPVCWTDAINETSYPWSNSHV